MLNLQAVGWITSLEIFKVYKKKGYTSADLIASEIFYQGVCDIYLKKHAHLQFSDFYWTYRSMFALVFYFLLLDLPETDIYHSVSTGYAGFWAPGNRCLSCATDSHGAWDLYKGKRRRDH
jgi:hypothetical protein